MREDGDEPEETEPARGEAAPARASHVPSWVMLGFAVGVLFMWLLQVSVEEAAPEPPPTVEPAPLRTPGPPLPMAVEALFDRYGEYAKWENNVTEVVLWNPEAQAVIDTFELRRIGDAIFYRTIPALTRRLLNHGVPENLPIRFTESEAQYQQWLREVAQENQRQISRGIVEAIGGRRDPADGPPAATGGAK